MAYRDYLSVIYWREYNSWRGMVQRCTNPKAAYYELYGGSGVRIYEPWFKFEVFLNHIGPMPRNEDGTYLEPKQTLNRWPDSDGHYIPGNVRWAAHKQR